jgi:hypothetical protein
MFLEHNIYSGSRSDEVHQESCFTGITAAMQYLTRVKTAIMQYTYTIKIEC